MFILLLISTDFLQASDIYILLENSSHLFLFIVLVWNGFHLNSRKINNLCNKMYHFLDQIGNIEMFYWLQATFLFNFPH